MLAAGGAVVKTQIISIESWGESHVFLALSDQRGFQILPVASEDLAEKLKAELDAFSQASGNVPDWAR